MIPRITSPRASATSAASPPCPPPAWQRSLAEAVSSLGELLRLLELEADSLTEAGLAQESFPLRVPRGFVRRMRRRDPHDPLLRQVLPAAEELAAAPGYSPDPLAEGRCSPAPGLLHKYRGRALLVVTGACGVHCRYCFRRHFPYAEHRPRQDGWRPALEVLAGDPSLSEVILSGGDPLVLADDKLGELAGELAEIPHLERLRIHTRMPIVLPERVDERLLAWLTASRLRPVVVVHANHGNEIDTEVRAAMQRLHGAGVTLLNQAVLLAGVNDRVEVLKNLSEALFEVGVLPYYLHLMDRVSGAAHFEVDEPTAKHLCWALMQQLPGYLVPRLVREESGAPAKYPICPVDDQSVG